MTTLGSDASLRITEVFCSLQGESSWAGERSVFVRLTGCPLRCVYCDSAYAFSGGEVVNIDKLLAQVASYQARYVCVTGGEPLAQPGCQVLLSRLCDSGYNVSLETSGALDISAVDPRVKKVVDLKTPSSGEIEKNRYGNVEYLKRSDEVKFVIANRKDYEWALETVEQYELTSRVDTILFSPAFSLDDSFHSGISPRELADWVVKDNAPGRFQLQLHKLLWGDEPGY